MSAKLTPASSDRRLVFGTSAVTSVKVPSPLLRNSQWNRPKPLVMNRSGQ